MIERLKVLLTAQERTRLGLLVSMLVVKAVLQVIGIASILPFMALVANPNLVHTNKWLNAAYEFGGFESEHAMLVATGVAVLVYMALSNLYIALLGWIQSRYLMGVAHRMGARLISSYITEPYEFFLTQSSINLLKRVVQEVSTFVKQVMLMTLEAISKGLVSLVIFILLFYVDAQLASIVFAVLGGSYLIIFVLKRKLMHRLGKDRLSLNKARFQSLADLMSGIKEIQLYGARPFFFERYFEASRRLSTIAPRMQLVSMAPRYLVETLAYGGILLVTLYLIEFSGSLEEIIPILSLYAVAGYRLLPSLQGTFQSLATARHAWPVVDEVTRDYHRPVSPGRLRKRKRVERLPFERSVAVKNLTFAYGGEELPAIRSIDLTIAKGSKVGIVGRTGSGKTTLVDVLTGLLRPSSGQIEVDGVQITEQNVVAWQDQIGYVTQELFLFDDTVAQNIAFGVPRDEIDQDRVVEVARIAQAHEFITELLPQGYDTRVRERGVRLSGGQRVRLGVARALYRRPTILILDEATSALDGITEHAIIEHLVQASGDLTLLLIAHRMATVKACDTIYLLEDGRVSDTGTFSDLLKTSDVFSEMRELTS